MGAAYFTRAGHQKLTEELQDLKSRGRKAIALAIREATAMGDLRENAEYESAKREQSLMETRISYVEDRLSRATILEARDISTDAVMIGTSVELEDLKTKERLTYSLVGEDESNFAEGKIAITTPVARGLLGKRPGELAKVTVPAGLFTYKIISIQLYNGL